VTQTDLIYSPGFGGVTVRQLLFLCGPHFSHL
jgi:hypothetical protein